MLLMCFKTTETIFLCLVLFVCASLKVSFCKLLPPHWDHLCCVQTLHVLVDGKWCSKKGLFFLQNYMHVDFFKMGNKILVSFPFCNLCVKYLEPSFNYLHWWKACVTAEGCSQRRSESESCWHCSDPWRSVVLLFLGLS